MSNLLAKLHSLSLVPDEHDKYSSWLEQQDSRAFLTENLIDSDFVVFASFPHVYVYSVLVDKSRLDPPDVEDLMSWSFGSDSTWGVVQTFDPPSVALAPPLSHTGSDSLDRGEPLVMARSFEARLGDTCYYEVLQKFVHVLNVHFLSERNSYCSFDDYGEVQDIIRIAKVGDEGGDSSGSAVLVRRQELDRYLALSECVLVRVFDFTRLEVSRFGGWPHDQEPDYYHEDGLHYRLLLLPDYASYMRGFQTVSSGISNTELLDTYSVGRRERREYAEFIAHDWKNGEIKIISTHPAATANYFTRSALPFEMSPAFFRPEVLAKYKADSDKYRLENRSVSCRGAWHLETFDINEAGQVHTYIGYLRNLPYEEQLYWKSYNEEPKAPISERARKTDFEGSWDLDYDPLLSLKHCLRDLDSEGQGWWRLRTEDQFDRVHYPVTTSADEWAEELLRLDQLVVEGLDEKWLRSRAQELGREPQSTLRSLKLLEECLSGLGFSEERARGTMGPFHELHNLRSKLKGHASGMQATAIKKETLDTHGNYSTHFRTLCEDLDKSLRLIAEELENS